MITLYGFLNQFVLGRSALAQSAAKEQHLQAQKQPLSHNPLPGSETLYPKPGLIHPMTPSTFDGLAWPVLEYTLAILGKAYVWLASVGPEATPFSSREVHAKFGAAFAQR